MRRMTWLAALAIASLAHPGWTQSSAAPDLASLVSPLDGAAPGCSVGVNRHGRAVHRQAFGSANLEHGLPIRTESVFDIASVAKQFTAASILMLAAEGRLDLADPVRKHLPEIPDYGAPLTIEHLLTHTGGVRNFTTMSALYESAVPPGFQNQDVVNLAARQRGLEFKPGAEYNYSNTGYVLLAVIVARVSGQSLADFTQARIFGPLGMTSTRWRTDARAVVPGRVTAYQRFGGAWRAFMPYDNVVGSGALLSTTGDLLRWSDALNRGELGADLSRELVRRGVTSDGVALDYARGFNLGDLGGHAEVYHAGGAGGFRSWLGRYPDDDLTIAVLCNADNSLFVDDIGRRLARALLGVSPEDAAAADPAVILAESERRRREGLFIERGTGRLLQLKTDGERLRLDGGAVRKLGPDRYERPEWGRLAFEGEDRLVVERPGRASATYDRAVRPALGATDLSRLTGRYFSDELAQAYLVSVSGGRLLMQLESRPLVGRFLDPVAPGLFEGAGVFLRVRDGGEEPVLELHVPPWLSIALTPAPAASTPR